jgi:hypothetical protein
VRHAPAGTPRYEWLRQGRRSRSSGTVARARRLASARAPRTGGGGHILDSGDVNHRLRSRSCRAAGRAVRQRRRSAVDLVGILEIPPPTGDPGRVVDVETVLVRVSRDREVARSRSEGGIGQNPSPRPLAGDMIGPCAAQVIPQFRCRPLVPRCARTARGRWLGAGPGNS